MKWEFSQDSKWLIVKVSFSMVQQNYLTFTHCSFFHQTYNWYLSFALEENVKEEDLV